MYGLNFKQNARKNKNYLEPESNWVLRNHSKVIFL